MTAWRDASAVALGMTTFMRSSPPSGLSRAVAARALLLGLLVSLALAGLVSAVLLTGRWIVGAGTEPLLASALAVAAYALLTGAGSWEGLARTVDDWRAGHARDVSPHGASPTGLGAAGATALVLTVLVQVIALSRATATGSGSAAVVLSVMVGRSALVVACTRTARSTMPSSHGSAVANSVPWVATALLVVAILGLAGALGLEDADGGAKQFVVAAFLGLLPGAVALGRSAERGRGPTGHSLEAVAAVAATGVLVVLAASPDSGAPDWAWLPF